jgi:hypothetical protein
LPPAAARFVAIVRSKSLAPLPAATRAVPRSSFSG